MKSFFETISKTELHFSEKLNDRDFIHLYDFQKFFIHRSIRRITELVKVKQYHYWNVKREIAAWQKLNLNLDDLSYEMIDLIMTNPCKSKDLCAVVRKISKYICVQLSQDLDKENINPKEDSSSETESESDEEY
ncbi:uncharacterized protein LOC129567854 [Sitodiplosis mosellana]|uniref:uncharacterized protein LOC129567854 n=1 Tax=Sitodiplosis mosellana TaxID=263140 RepID=UPI002443F41E|nr:uncharacterized protein LOC129567854 [Sitodiplosis mosellana]